VLTVLSATAGLVVLDQYDAPRFRQTSAFKGFNSALSGTNTSLGITLVPVSLYSAGLLARDSYAQNTALFIGEAVADTEILGTFLKVATDRLRPLNVPVNGNFADTAFERGGYVKSSFPSGHTLAAFSVATVVSRRYGRHRPWVPVLAYGLASAVGFSRMSLSAHFPSDVFMGAVLGYSVSRFNVLRE
jgi:membrane-associated phospholipid phosphatase